MMKNKNFLKVLLLFLVCFSLGMSLAQRKPVWNDEIYSQLFISRASYKEIFLGRIPEGNVCPLFYSLQKAITGIVKYEPPPQWHKGKWDFSDKRSQLVLRILPVFFMSLGIMMIFWYFLYFFSEGAGFYSILVTLTTYMVWAYWAEARPYALWFFLSVLQLILFLYVVDNVKRAKLKAEGFLIATHILLSLTVIFGGIQVVGVSALLWVVGRRSWRKHLFLTVIPLIITVFYYLRSPHYQFWFAESPLKLIFANIPRDRLFILGLYILYGIYLVWKNHGQFALVKKDIKISSGLPFMLLAIFFIAVAGGLLGMFSLGASTGKEGFQISNRYFMYLTPLGIIGTVLASVEFFRQARRHVFAKYAVIGVLGGLLILRIIRTYVLVKGFYA